MAYFTAVIARSGTTWKARDVEVDDATSLDDLAESLRASAIDDQPILAVIEHEDEWFALIRVDGDDEPRLFVSNLAASLHGHYAEMLVSAADVDALDDDDPDGASSGAASGSGSAADPGSDGAGPGLGAGPHGDPGDESGDDPDAGRGSDDDEPTARSWAGDPELLDDLGLAPRILRKLTEDKGDDPGAALADIGEVVGFADLLETLR